MDSNKPIFDFNKYTIGHIVEKYKKSDANLKPYDYYVNQKDYQRGIVWTDTAIKKMFKTLLDGFLPPAIIVWKNETKNDGTYFWEVIDGQQRLNAFARITRHKGFKMIDFPKEYKPIKENEITTILNKIKGTNIQVVEISNCDKSKAKEYFELINTSGAKLNSQEVRWSKYNDSDVFKLLSEIQNHDLYKKIEETNEEDDILKLRCVRKTNEVQITTLFRLWLMRQSEKNNTDYCDDTKAKLDAFYSKELSKYKYEENHVKNFLSALSKFQNIYTHVLTQADKHKIFNNFYYFLVMWGIFLEDKLASADLIHFFNSINYIDDGNTAKYLSEQERKNFMSSRSTTKKSRGQSREVYMKFLENKNGKS